MVEVGSEAPERHECVMVKTASEYVFGVRKCCGGASSPSSERVEGIRNKMLKQAIYFVTSRFDRSYLPKFVVSRSFVKLNNN